VAHILSSLSGTAGPVLNASKVSQANAELIIKHWLPEYAGLGCRDILYRIYLRLEQEAAKSCQKKECDC
jgi:hypothetical protein